MWLKKINEGRLVSEIINGRPLQVVPGIPKGLGSSRLSLQDNSPTLDSYSKQSLETQQDQAFFGRFAYLPQPVQWWP